MNLLKELHALGYGHVISGFVVVIAALWARLEIANRKQNRTREEWHTSTLGRVDNMQVHIDECNEDREMLKKKTGRLETQVAVLNERAGRISNCPIPACPNRQAR